MLKKALFLVGLVAVLGMVTPEQASACEDCRPKLRCINDECTITDECQGVPPLQTSFENCSIIWGICSTSGDVCGWT